MNLKFHIFISISGHMNQSSTNYEHYSVPRRRTPLRSNSLCDIRSENLSSQGTIWKSWIDPYLGAIREFYNSWFPAWKWPFKAYPKNNKYEETEEKSNILESQKNSGIQPNNDFGVFFQNEKFSEIALFISRYTFQFEQR